jgi:F-type H+-transporting ATPase subunit b
MLIDWFTVCAQALNFLILVWLMKRFLYKPILAAIDAREKLIAGELADAAAKKADAGKDRDTFAQKTKDFDQQRADLLSKASDAAKAEGQRLLAEAAKAANALAANRQQSIIADAQSLHQAIGRRAQQEVFAIARKTLGDLASVTLESQMIEVFVTRLREIDSKTKDSLGHALKTGSGPAVIRSTFDLPEDLRASIQKAINETFSADIHIQFDTAPDLISGIELSANGQKVAWSIEEYLSSLQMGVEALLTKTAAPNNNTGPKPDPLPEAKAA